MQNRIRVFVQYQENFRPFDLDGADALLLQVADCSYPLLRASLGLPTGGKLALKRRPQFDGRNVVLLKRLCSHRTEPWLAFVTCRTVVMDGTCQLAVQNYAAAANR